MRRINRKLNRSLIASMLGMLLYSIPAIAQMVDVNGKIVSEENEPLPGATVIVVGTDIGTKTNIEGEFKLKAETGSSLRVTFSGFEPTTYTVPTGGTDNAIIVLYTQAFQGKEVVVTALEINREKRSLGYGAQTVTADEVNSARGSSVLSSLSGKAAGVKISQSSGVMGGSSRISIRGANSVTGDNKPLFIVDGAPIGNQDFSNDLHPIYTKQLGLGRGATDFGNMAQDINPEDIENISILRGPSAAALYGARAANGVVIITTKKARIKTDGDPTIGISVNTGVEFTYTSLHPKLQNKYGGGPYPGDGKENKFDEIEREVDELQDDGTIKKKLKKFLVVSYKTDETWGPKFDPNLKVLHWDAFDPEFKEDYLKPRPWVASPNDVHTFYETGITTRNNVSLSGGTDRMSARFSYTNDYTKGIFPNSHLLKHTAYLNTNFKLGDLFDIAAAASFINLKGHNRPTIGYDGNSVAQKFYQWGQRQLDMERLKKYKTVDGKQRTWNRTKHDNPSPYYSDNPYWIVNENYDSDARNRIIGNVKVISHLTDFLKLRLQASVDAFSFRKEEQIAIGSQELSSYAEEIRTVGEYNYEAILLFSKDFFDENLSVLATFGYNLRQNNSYINRVKTAGGLVIRNFYNALNTKSASLETYDRKFYRFTNSLFGNISFGIMDVFYLELTGRNDWSSTLPIHNNSFFYPSVNASLVLTDLLPLIDETVEIDKNVISFLKIRGGFAQVSKDTEPYQLQNAYTPKPNYGPHTRYAFTDRRKNPNLKPETTTSWEIGLEIGALDSRINLDLAYYNNITTDQIIFADVPKGTGFDQEVLNLGKMENWGVELSLLLNPVRLDLFDWQLNLQWSLNRNKVLALAEDVNTFDLGRNFKAYIVAEVGKSYPVIQADDYAYDLHGNRVVDVNGRYVTQKQRSSVAKVSPDWNMGITNTFTFNISRAGTISLGMLIDIQSGGNYYSIGRMWGMYSGMLEETVSLPHPEGGYYDPRETNIVLPAAVAVEDKNKQIIYVDKKGNEHPLDEKGNKIPLKPGEKDPYVYPVTNVTKDGVPAKNTTSISAKQWGVDQYSRVNTDNVLSSSYVKIRELTLVYTMPKTWFLTTPIQGLSIGVYGRNLATFSPVSSRYGFDPEINYGSTNEQGIDGGTIPSTTTFGFNINITF